MSKNPAWNACNEATRKANEEYESSVKPLRVTLAKDIRETEKRFDEQIVPLQIEKKENIDMLKNEYSDKVMEAEAKRRKAVKVAHDVLNAELAAARSEKVAA